MACKGCPGVESLSTPARAGKSTSFVPAIGGENLVAYGGGPPIRQLAYIGYTLPKDSGIKFHPDGRIECEPGKAPEAINGYLRDQENPNLFHPQWEHCPLRLMGAKQEPLDVIAQCIHPHAETFSQSVTHADCHACPLRQKLTGPQA